MMRPHSKSMARTTLSHLAKARESIVEAWAKTSPPEMGEATMRALTMEIDDLIESVNAVLDIRDSAECVPESVMSKHEWIQFWKDVKA